MSVTHIRRPQTWLNFTRIDSLVLWSTVSLELLSMRKSTWTLEGTLGLQVNYIEHVKLDVYQDAIYFLRKELSASIPVWRRNKVWFVWSKIMTNYYSPQLTTCRHHYSVFRSTFMLKEQQNFLLFLPVYISVKLVISLKFKPVSRCMRERNFRAFVYSRSFNFKVICGKTSLMMEWETSWKIVLFLWTGFWWRQMPLSCIQTPEHRNFHNMLKMLWLKSENI